MHNVFGDGFTSGDPATKGSYSFTFAEPGTYTYYCIVHRASGMTGTIIVE
jgi:plastocyanin